MILPLANARDQRTQVRPDVTDHAPHDDAVERAINKSSPLPLPDDRGLFRRDLELKFRPQELR